MSILTSILSFLAAITFLVFIHEYGHFKVARLCGVKVRRFSIGFGKPFYSRLDSHGTEWAIAPIPLGGYVSMVDSRVEELAPGEEAVAFDRKPLIKRAAIVIAGPLANLLFAWLAWSFMMAGPTQDLTPRFGSFAAGSLADKAGFQADDLIASVDGAPVRSLSGATLAVLSDALAGRDASLVAKRAGRDVALTLPSASVDPTAMASTGMRAFGFANSGGAALPARIKSVTPGSPADKGGMLAGDEVVAIDGAPIDNWSAMAAKVNASAGKTLAMQVKSASGALRSLSVSPKAPEGAADGLPKIGASLDDGKLTAEQKARAFVTVDRSYLSAMADSAKRCAQMSQMTYSAIGSMFTTKSGAATITGPVGIAQQAGDAADAGVKSYFSFLAFLSLSLFLMNLLPLPALDGGHLALFALEALMGRPLSPAAQGRIGQIGFSLLAGMMVVALYNDVSKLFH